MARRSLLEHVALSVKVPRGHEGFWTIIQQLHREQGTFTISDVVSQTNVVRSTVADYVKRLEKAGYLALQEGSDPPRYALIKTSRDAPRVRRDGTVLVESGQDTLWRTIKMLKQFTVAALHAEVTAARPMPLVTVQSYVKHLTRAGVLAKRPIGGNACEFRLIRNLGGAAPRVLRTHLVFDPNSNTVLGSPEAKEVS